MILFGIESLNRRQRRYQTTCARGAADRLCLDRSMTFKENVTSSKKTSRMLQTDSFCDAYKEISDKSCKSTSTRSEITNIFNFSRLQELCRKLKRLCSYGRPGSWLQGCLRIRPSRGSFEILKSRDAVKGDAHSSSQGCLKRRAKKLIANPYPDQTSGRCPDIFDLRSRVD